MKEKEVQKENDHLRLRGPGRCPFCRDVISDKTELVACAACGARHHEGCHREHGACASCGSSEVLVPQSKARKVRERPPKGSVIEVEELEDGALSYTWPAIRNKVANRIALLVLVLMILTIPLAFLIWWHERKHPFRTIVLERDRLKLPRYRPFRGYDQIDVDREDVGAIRHEHHNGFPALTVDVGVDRTQVANQAQLKEPELEWLCQALKAWQENG